MQRHVQLNSHLRKPEWMRDAPFKMYQLANKWELCLMRTWSSLTVCWAEFHSWQCPERRRYWRNDWDVDPASLHVNYTQWDGNHSWSLSAEGEPQRGGQAQRPWSQRHPRETINALITFPCHLQLPKRRPPAFTDHPVGFPFLSSYCHSTGGKKSSFQTSFSQASPRNNFNHFAISHRSRSERLKDKLHCVSLISFFFSNFKEEMEEKRRIGL